MKAGAHIFNISYARQPNLFFGVPDQISNPSVEYALDRLIEFQLVDRVRIDRFDLAVEVLEDRDTVADLLEREQAGFVAIVEVGRAVGNFIGNIDELSFERRSLRSCSMSSRRERTMFWRSWLILTTLNS